MPYLHAFSTFRDNVRSLARSSASPKQVLEFCDKFRDVDLVALGVALDDQEGKYCVVDRYIIFYPPCRWKSPCQIGASRYSHSTQK